MSENAITWPVVDFVALKSINSDCVAWIRIDGTEIDYPVVQGHDNSFYLKHLFGGEWNGAGCIFLDSRVEPDLSDRHSVLYGHHMKNGTMFSDIADYKDQTYYENHATGMILTPSKNYWIEFFAGYVAGADDENAWKVTFATEDEYVDWLNETVGRSWFKSEVIPTAEDRVITLSTCSYEFNKCPLCVGWPSEVDCFGICHKIKDRKQCGQIIRVMTVAIFSSPCFSMYR